MEVILMGNANSYLDLFKTRDSICVSHYPVPVSQHTNAEVIKFMELNRRDQQPKEIAVYIHIPFCDRICSFCPFNKYVKDRVRVVKYLNALMKEIELYANTPYGKSAFVKSINFGGGTPTSLELEEISGILQKIKNAFHVAEDAMIFVEGNPRNFTYEKLAGLRKEGLNRISVGVQTFQPNLSAYLELYHSVADSLNLVRNAKKAGINNVGIDLMYNIPGQSTADWAADIEKAIELGIDHICLISFCVVPHTRISKRIKEGIVPEIGDCDKEIELYTLARKLLMENGYEQYSVIDFAKPGKIDIHAKMYFGEQKDLIGLGAAAFGFINGYMYVNTGEIEEYVERLELKELPVSCGEKADELELAHGAMAKGLRMLTVKRDEFRNRFGCEPEDLFGETISFLSGRGLIRQDAEGIHLTADGIVWGNNVCKEFFSQKYKNFGLRARMKLAKGQSIDQGEEEKHE